LEAILAISIALLFIVLFGLSLLDIALRSVNYFKISIRHHRGDPDAQKLFSLLSSPERAISVLLFLRYAFTATLFLLAGIYFYRLEIAWPIKTGVVLLFILMMLSILEYIPRMVAVQNPEKAAFLLLRPFEFALKLNQLLPLPQAFEKFASAVLRLYGFSGEKIFSQYSVNEIKMFLSLNRGNADPELGKQAIDYKLMNFSERRVREVMVPRPFVRALEMNSPLRNVLKAIQENGYSRMPVYRGSLDNILGILHVKDIIGMSEPFSLEQHLKPPFFVPEAATVQASFRNMQRNHIHLAIIVDEYGGVEGIVTLEDLIEELIGEIQDEHDEDAPMLHRVSEESWLLEGNLTIKELNQKLNLDVPEKSTYTTVAGFLISVLDRIPNEREEIRYGQLIFSVEKMLGHKIAKASLKLPKPAKNASPK
jgi:magnesium and cobalt exporter, CNNM family